MFAVRLQGEPGRSGVFAEPAERPSCAEGGVIVAGMVRCHIKECSEPAVLEAGSFEVQGAVPLRRCAKHFLEWRLVHKRALRDGLVSSLAKLEDEIAEIERAFADLEAIT
jgi:hypothetical protein